MMRSPIMIMTRDIDSNSPVTSWRIVHLGERLDCLPTLAFWLYQEWLRPAGDSLEQAYAILRSQLWGGTIPTTWVAVDSHREPHGMVSLSTLYLPHGEMAGCLAGLFVTPESRNRGLGTLLCDRAVREARVLGIAPLVLRTSDKVSFYERRGWKRRASDRSPRDGDAPLVMEFDGDTVPAERTAREGHST